MIVVPGVLIVLVALRQLPPDQTVQVRRGQKLLDAVAVLWVARFRVPMQKHAIFTRDFGPGVALLGNLVFPGLVRDVREPLLLFAVCLDLELRLR
jgi:hypothetical protein